MRIKNLTYLVAAILLLHNSDLKAQWGGRHSYHWDYSSYIMGNAVRIMKKKPFQRFSVGVTYVPVSSTFSYQTVDNNDIADSIRSINVKGAGYGVAYAMGIPVAQTGNKSLAAISVGILANWYLLSGDQLNVTMKQTYYSGHYSYSGAGMGFMFGLPVGLDLVSGGEASLDRSDRFSFTLGAGFIPMITMSGMYKFVGLKAMAPAYAKIELGFHAGINWKLRAMYISKSPTSFSQDRDDIFNEYGTVKGEMKSNDQIMFSLLVQPFSFGWE